MKKILTLSLAALMAFSTPANAVFAAPATKVEAASVNLKAAAATAVSTAEDLKAMESNPSGNYYLATVSYTHLTLPKSDLVEI